MNVADIQKYNYSPVFIVILSNLHIIYSTFITNAIFFWIYMNKLSVNENSLPLDLEGCLLLFLLPPLLFGNTMLSDSDACGCLYHVPGFKCITLCP